MTYPEQGVRNRGTAFQIFNQCIGLGIRFCPELLLEYLSFDETSVGQEYLLVSTPVPRQRRMTLLPFKQWKNSSFSHDMKGSR